MLIQFAVKDNIHRTKVVRELLSSEETYVVGLNVINTVCFFPFYVYICILIYFNLYFNIFIKCIIVGDKKILNLR